MSKRKIAAIVCIVLAAVGIALLAVWNMDEQKTVDISGLQSQQIVVGINPHLQECEALTPMHFAGKSYDLVMVGVENPGKGKITYLGLVNGEYYQTTEEISLGVLQEVKQMKIDNQNLVINCGKDRGDTACFSILIAFIVGFLIPRSLRLWED